MTGSVIVMAGGTAAVVAVVVAAVKGTIRANKRLRDEWDGAGRALGIARPEPGFFSDRNTLQGVAGGLPVSVKGHDGKGANTLSHPPRARRAARRGGSDPRPRTARHDRHGRSAHAREAERA